MRLHADMAIEQKRNLTKFGVRLSLKSDHQIADGGLAPEPIPMLKSVRCPSALASPASSAESAGAGPNAPMKPALTSTRRMDVRKP